MPISYIGRFAVVPTDGLYVVVDREAGAPALMPTGNPAVFAIAKDACLWAICRAIADNAQKKGKA
jgi:hypothetical protein